MKNRIIVISMAKRGHRISVMFSAEGDCARCFQPEREFWVEYSDDVATVPNSVAVIPFICNILPIVWLTDATLVVPELDKDFYDSIPEIKKGYEGMYPDMTFAGKIEVGNVINNVPAAAGGVGAFFSGGVDAFCTLYSHLDEHPVLITLWGADVRLTDEAGWAIVRNHLRETSELLKVDSVVVKTNFRQFIYDPAVEALVKDSGDMYWHGFHHGIGIIGHGAPIAYVRGLSTIYIASSFTAAEKGYYKCASDPTIDNKVRFCHTFISHDGFQYHRQQKVDLICEVAKRINAYPTLRVCWITIGGQNCCKCEKCLRTIYELLAAGENPKDYGFAIDNVNMSRNRWTVLSNYKSNRTLPYVWLKTQQQLKERDASQLPDWARWILTSNLEKDSHSIDVTLYMKCRSLKRLLRWQAARILTFLRLK